ncbi:unnamed protein product [Miscanthus lutarioriparius]|uniref:BHLH domain-containing protein n=1 Tax=Miscanthus lutarioriparius TaxID=422564 RepID=A0A811SH43_9POAL|nr:unnamed protein product [Miscanthus lutarioriparius]
MLASGHTWPPVFKEEAERDGERGGGTRGEELGCFCHRGRARTGPGDELAELLWDHGPAPAPPPFQPFTCSAAGSSRSQELKRHAADATKAAAFVTPVVPVPLGMHGAGAGLGLGGLPVHDDEDDAVPWLHCPCRRRRRRRHGAAAPEYFASLLSEYSEAATAPAAASHAAAVVLAAPPPPEAGAANKLAPAERRRRRRTWTTSPKRRGGRRRGSAKRSRTAEGHNLSERRRRDRINEKMRALQELIPNCNKIDKASMLEEAIEYPQDAAATGADDVDGDRAVHAAGDAAAGDAPAPAGAAPPPHGARARALPAPRHGARLQHGRRRCGFDMLPRAVAAGAHFPCTPMAMPPSGAMFGVPGQGMPR